jgi:serine/threonine protein phosphatase PrpC
VPIADSQGRAIRTRARERRATRRLDLAGRSDKGRLRERNEDQFVIAELGRFMHVSATSVGEEGAETMSLQGTLLVVADGMGGDGAGDVASTIALESLLHHAILAMPWLGIGSPEADAVLRMDVETFVVSLQARLVQLASERTFPRTLGTTLTVGYIQDSRLVLAHIGGSRAYVSRRGALSLVTRDHTQALTTGEREILRVSASASGDHGEPPRPDLSSVALEAGDRVLLCTDGLSTCLPDARIAELVAAAPRADHAARALVDEALRAGAPDNVTALSAIG